MKKVTLNEDTEAQSIEKQSRPPSINNLTLGDGDVEPECIKCGKRHSNKVADLDTNLARLKESNESITVQPNIPYKQIFRYADAEDYFLLVLGTMAAAIHGAGLPSLFVVFGNMTDAFVTYGKFANCRFDFAVCVEMQIVSNTTTETAFNETISAIDLDNRIATNALYYVLLAAIVFVFASLQIICWMWQSARQVSKIRLMFFRNILRQDISFFDTTQAAELNTRLADDILKIQAGISDKMSISIHLTCRAIAGYIIGVSFGWKLTLVIAAVAPFLIASNAIMFKMTKRYSQLQMDAYAKAGAVAEEIFSAIRTVVAFSGQDKESERYDKNLLYAKKVGIKKGFVIGCCMGTIFMLKFSAYGLAFWYGSQLVLHNEPNFTLGDMLTCFIGVLIGSFAIGQAAVNMEYFAAAKAAAYKIFEVIDRTPTIDSMSDNGLKPDHIAGKIEFKNVCFHYPSRPDVQILRNVSLVAESGVTTSFCGQSGCGKSTCFQLLQRFYDPQSGSIELDGIDIRELNLRWLRQHIGVVCQEPILFDDTIAENIRYGRPDATREDIYAATKQANAYDFITKLPQKFETRVGEDGGQMSGGQKQRIAIARAIVRNPKIMLLDEATSALDTESESLVQAALEKASKGCTTIVIAHRLSTIRNSRKIYGFLEGEVVEGGSHDELRNSEGGVYKNLVELQSFGTFDEDKRRAPQAKMHMRRVSTKQRRFSTKSYNIATASETTLASLGELGFEEKIEDVADENLPNVPFSQILAFNRPEINLILLGCFGAAINGAVQPIFAIIFAAMLSVLALPPGDYQQNQIVLFAWSFVTLGAASLFGNIVESGCFGISGERLTERLRSRGFRAILRQDMGYFDEPNNSTGALCSRLATDASKVQGCSGVRAGTVIQSVFALGTAIAIGFGYGWQMTLLTLAFAPFMICAGLLTMKVMSGQSGNEMKAFEKAAMIATEATTHIRTVVSLTRENEFYAKFEKALKQPTLQARKKAFFYGLSFGFSNCVLFLAYAATFRYGGYLVSEGIMEFHNVYKCLMAVIFAAFALGQSASFAPDFAEAKIASGRIFKLIDTKPSIDSWNKDGIKLESVRGKISYNEVQFSYPTRPDMRVLKGLTMHIQPGQTVAFVGRSGCGKSTCIQLLQRFYDPTDGFVTVDDCDTNRLQLESLRSNLGIVSQEPTLFNRSIADNIRYGDNKRFATLDEVVAAAKSANVHSFIQSLPEGYDTCAGSKGAQLSGGQKQRIAIARALLRNPKILLLDEATSALDSESEKIVQDALETARSGRTCIVIAHRLSTVRDADVIVVIENGAAVEYGSHDQLISHHGAYFRLVNSQLIIRKLSVRRQSCQSQQYSDRSRNDSVYSSNNASRFEWPD